MVWASLSSILQAHTTARNVHLFSSCYSIRHHVLMTLTSTTLMLLLLLQNDEKQSCRKVVIKSCFSSKGMTSWNPRWKRNKEDVLWILGAKRFPFRQVLRWITIQIIRYLLMFFIYVACTFITSYLYVSVFYKYTMQSQ